MIQRFKQVVGSIAILFESISPAALAKLLGVGKRNIDSVLSTLRSVLDVPESKDSPIRLLHTSFRDFLLDKRFTAQDCSNLL